MFRKLISIIVCGLCNTAIAADFVGKVKTIATGPSLGNIVLVQVEEHSSSAAWSSSCSANSYWSFKFDTSLNGGKEAYSLLLSAHAAKSNVVLSGAGTCSGQWGDVQDMAYTRFE